MKRVSSVTRLSFLLAVTTLPLGACIAPSIDPDGEPVAEAEDGLSTWVVDTQVPGQTSRSAPALTTYNYDAVMVHRGGTNDNLYISTYDSSKWSQNTQIPNVSSKDTPALTQHGPKLHMAYRCGSSTALCYTSFQTGGSWSLPVTLSYQSSVPPALASDPITNRLMMVYLTTYGSLRHAFNDGDWQPSAPVLDYMYLPPVAKPPALAVHQGRVHMVFEDQYGFIRHTSWNGSFWEPPTVLDKSERNNPALASYAGKLYLFHRGTNDNKIWWSSSVDGQAWTADVSVPVALTQASPAIATGGVVLVLTHLAQSGTNLWYSTFTF